MAKTLNEGKVRFSVAGTEQRPSERLAVERALRLHDEIVDVVVRHRFDLSGTSRLVAYAVPAEARAVELTQLQAALDEASPASAACIVWLSAIPLTAQGIVDEEALDRVPVLDDACARRCEQALQAISGVEEAAATIHVRRPRVEALPLDGLVSVVDTRREGRPPVSDPVSPPRVGSNERHAEPSLSEGSAISSQSDEPATLPEALIRAADRAFDKGIVHVQLDGSELEESYAALFDDARRVVAGLRALGLAPGARLILQLESSKDFLAGFWACQLGGYVPVPMAALRQLDFATAEMQRLAAAWQLLDRPAVLADAQRAEMLATDGMLGRFGKINVARIDELRRLPPDPRAHASRPEDVAIMLLTSGSTGIPKAVCQSHRALLSRSAAWALANSDSASDVTFNWMPLDHVGGIVMWHLRDVFLGCRQLHAPSEYILRDPLRWLDAIERHRVTNTWAPNFAYGLICDRMEEIRSRHWDLSCVRYFLNGGESIVARTARRFLKILAPHRLPATAMLPAWGMSETCSGVTYDNAFSLAVTSDDDPYVCVGEPIPGTAIRIVNAQDCVVPQETVGRLQVKGTTVTSGYFNAPEASRDAFTRDGWFITGDLAMMREGRITITGREKDVIIINGVNYGCHQIEAAVEEIDGVDVSNTAACSVRSRTTGTEGLAIFFTTPRQSDAELRPLLADVRKRVLERIGIGIDYLLTLQPADIPKTSIGKIQRTQLRERFEAGEFDPIVRRIENLRSGGKAIPDWFYRVVWQSARLRGESETTSLEGGGATIAAARGVTVVFPDAGGVASAAIEALRSRGATVVVAESSSAFSMRSRAVFSVDPEQPEHYMRLLHEVERAHGPVNRVMHCFACDASTTEPGHVADLAGGRRHLRSVLFLIQALERARAGPSHVDLLVVSAGAQMIDDDHALAYGNAVVPGLLRTVRHELPWLRCRHVDLTPGDVARGDALADELETCGNEPEVAYRRGERLVSCVENAQLLASVRARPPVRKGGLYMITGGLGGVGTAIARYLMERFDARLILIGRGARPEADPLGERAGHSASAADRRSENYRFLQSVGGDFRYEPADVSDPASLRDVVARAEQRWGQNLDGIFHLASVGVWSDFKRHRLVNEQPDAFEHMFRAKVDGTWCLANLLEDRPDADLVVFSSVFGVFGAATYGAYAAANAFLEPYIRSLRRRGRRAYCFHWSMWENFGMTAESRFATRSAAESLGYGVISPETGFYSLLAGIGRDEPALIVGADAATPAVRARMRTDADACQEVIACYSGSADPGAVDVAPIRVHDEFGTLVVPALERVGRIPRTNDGAVDWPQLLKADRSPTSRAEERQGRTPLESRLAEIWSEVLGAPAVGNADNFFAMGGDSIRAAVVVNRIQETLGASIPMVTLFKNPTVGELAVAVAAQHPRATSPVAMQEGRTEAKQLNKGVAGLEATRGPHRRSAGAVPENTTSGAGIPVHQSEEEALLSKLDELSEEALEMLLAKHSRPPGGHHE